MTPQEHMTSAQFRARHARESNDLALSRPRSKFHAKPVTVDGIRHASQLEQRVYEDLRAAFPDAIVLRNVKWDLPCIGQGETWRPDFTLLNPFPGDVWQVAVHEAKGVDTRDFRLRLKAFLVSYPRVPVTVWRRKGRRDLQCEHIEPREAKEST